MNKLYLNREQQPTNKFDIFLLCSLLIAVLFIPPYPLTETFHLATEEIITVLVGLRVIQRGYFRLDAYLLLLLSMAVYIAFVIFINPNWRELREYFEVYKAVKYAFLYLFAFHVLQTIDVENLFKMINYSFMILVLFNLFHYHDLFDFNEHVTKLYDPNKIDIERFGLRSDGSPGPKRIIGTMGNPNDNAILFLIYFAIYLYRICINNIDNLSKVLFYVSFTMILFCQSRTSLLTVAVCIATSYYIVYTTKNDLKKHSIRVLYLLIIAALFITYGALFGYSYIANTELELMNNNSFSSRYETWKFLVNEWMQKPLFGYGPNKTFIYSNNFYPENEYLYFLWRYGIIGLLFYLSVLLLPLYILYKKPILRNYLLLIMIIIATTALTNNPLSNSKISIILPLIVGFSLSLQYRTNPNQDE